jgi:hypothetical protein
MAGLKHEHGRWKHFAAPAPLVSDSRSFRAFLLLFDSRNGPSFESPSAVRAKLSMTKTVVPLDSD